MYFTQEMQFWQIFNKLQVDPYVCKLTLLCEVQVTQYNIGIYTILILWVYRCLTLLVVNGIVVEVPPHTEEQPEALAITIRLPNS